MEWQPIETAPKDGTPVLLFCPEGEDVDERFVAGWFDNHGPYQKEMGAEGVWMFDISGEPTHWMPLPDPPR